MSVQAGQSCYSVPNDVVDEYAEAEIGFPSIPEPLIKQYAEIMDVESSTVLEDDSWLCDTVYPYVPVEVVDEVISKHGGIDEGAVWDAMTEAIHNIMQINGSICQLEAQKEEYIEAGNGEQMFTWN
jgi:hypothetical protein